MAHARAAIRTALAAAVTGLTTTGTRVWVDRVSPLALANLPALIVTDDEEISEDVTTSGYRQERAFEATIAIFVQQLDGAAAAVDAIALEVEQAIAADRTLGGICDCRYAGFSRSRSDEGEQPIAVGSVRYAVRYSTVASTPTL